MRRYLVVANQTLQSAELGDEIRKRIGAGPSSFYVLVPDTSAEHYYVVRVPSGADPSETEFDLRPRQEPATDEDATAYARQRLSQMLADLTALGVPVEGDLGSSQPLEAMEKALLDHRFDEIIVAVLPQRVSRWLGADVPQEAERRFGLPVTTIVTASR
jgi:hypothetical protein